MDINDERYVIIDKKPGAVIAEKLMERLRVRGIGNKIVVKEGAKLGSIRIDFMGKNNLIEIGEGANFKRGEIRFVGNGQHLIIGKRTSIQECRFLCEEGCSIEVGDDCLFSYDINIRTTDAHSIVDTVTNERTNPAASIKIGNHVWIAQDVIVSKGVKIANNCVIGARSFVNRPQPESNTIIAGIPAKVVRSNINWASSKLPLGDDENLV